MGNTMSFQIGVHEGTASTMPTRSTTRGENKKREKPLDSEHTPASYEIWERHSGIS